MLDRKFKMLIKTEVMAKLAVANLTWLRETWSLLVVCGNVRSSVVVEVEGMK